MCFKSYPLEEALYRQHSWPCSGLILLPLLCVCSLSMLVSASGATRMTLLEHLLLNEACLTTQALSSPAPSTCIPSLQPGLFFFTAFKPLRIFPAYQFACYCLSPLWEYWWFLFFSPQPPEISFCWRNESTNEWLSINITPNETIYIICSVLLCVHLRRSCLSNQIINSQDVTSKLLLQPWKSSTVLNKYI